MHSDKDIINLFFERSEQAISILSEKYGSLCRKIAFGILKNNEDTEECLNSSYMNVWKSIPPTKPDSLTAYICTVVRNAAFEAYSRAKKHCCDTSLDELEWLVTEPDTVERLADGAELSEMLNSFLSKQNEKNRKIFMGRYYFNMSNAEIAERLKMSESAVKTRLSRIRDSLKTYLSDKGVL